MSPASGLTARKTLAALRNEYGYVQVEPHRGFPALVSTLDGSRRVFWRHASGRGDGAEFRPAMEEVCHG